MGCAGSTQSDSSAITYDKEDLVKSVPCATSNPSVAVRASGWLAVGVLGSDGQAQIMSYETPLDLTVPTVLIDNIPSKGVPNVAVRASGQFLVAIRALEDDKCKILNYAEPFESAVGEVLIPDVPCTTGVPSIAIRKGGSLLVGVRGRDGKAKILEYALPGEVNIPKTIIDDVPTLGVPSVALRQSGWLVVGVRSSEGKGQLLSYAGILAASTDSIGPPRDVLIDDVPGAEDPPTVAIRASGYMVVGTRAGSDKGGMLLSYVPRRRGH